MKVFGAVIGILIMWCLSWLIGGIVLTLAVRHCLFVHTIAQNLGVADLSFTNYANAALVMGMLNTRVNTNASKS